MSQNINKKNLLRHKNIYWHSPKLYHMISSILFCPWHWKYSTSKYLPLSQFFFFGFLRGNFFYFFVLKWIINQFAQNENWIERLWNFVFFWKNLCLSICNFSQMKKKSVIIQRPYFVVKQIVRFFPSAMFSSMRSKMLLRVLPTLTVNLNFLLQMIRKKNYFFLHLYFIHLYKTYIAIAVIYIFGMYTTKFIYFNFLHVFRPVPIFLFHFGVFIDKIFFFFFFFHLSVNSFMFYMDKSFPYSPIRKKKWKISIVKLFLIGKIL